MPGYSKSTRYHSPARASTSEISAAEVARSAPGFDWLRVRESQGGINPTCARRVNPNGPDQRFATHGEHNGEDSHCPDQGRLSASAFAVGGGRLGMVFPDGAAGTTVFVRTTKERQLLRIGSHEEAVWQSVLLAYDQQPESARRTEGLRVESTPPRWKMGEREA